jgi:hypothetical protein
MDLHLQKCVILYDRFFFSIQSFDLLVRDVERAAGTGPRKNIARDKAADAVLVLLREEEGAS